MKVGQTVAVVHRSVINPKTGLVKLEDARPQNRKITEEYREGYIKDSHGDIWKVNPTSVFRGASFVTIA